MKTSSMIVSALLLGLTIQASADEPAKTGDGPAKVTLAITGMHCAPCTKTIETSLGKVKGISSAKVDYTAKQATIQFDPASNPTGTSRATARSRLSGPAIARRTMAQS